MTLQETKHKSERGVWGNQLEFILACVGYAVGIGNVWRFPYLTYKNGGGVFLIPYFICLFIAALPLFYMELCLGQFSSLGPGAVFANLSPVFEGVGWGMVVVTFFTSIYYIMLMAYVMLYFVLSFRTQLLWSNCRNWWNTESCWSNLELNNCTKTFGNESIFFNKTCYTGATAVLYNTTLSTIDKVSPAEEFFENYILNLSDGFHDVGGLQWKLVVSLAAAWLITFLCLCKGVQSTGKVVYFTATFPYVVLTALLIRGVTLEGAGDGIYFYLNPNMTKLGDLGVWKDAAVQIFYSLGPAFGVVITMASYNRFHTNCYRDAIIVGVINSATSFFAGFAVFSIAGFMAHELGKNVTDVVRDGVGLAFIAYPEAMVRMPASSMWSVLFFFMLILLGLDSQFAFFETPLTAAMDTFPVLRQRKTLFIFVVAVAFFLMGLPLCTRGGLYFFILMNDYSAGYCLILLGLGEAVSVSYVYGIKNFFRDVQMMVGVQNGKISKFIGPTGYGVWFALVILAPILLLAILISSFFYYEVSKYGKYKFPVGPEIAGWIISTLSIMWVPIFAIYHLVKNRIQRRPLNQIWRATNLWCPADDRSKASAVPMGYIGPPEPIPSTKVYQISNPSPQFGMVHPATDNTHGNPGFEGTF